MWLKNTVSDTRQIIKKTIGYIGEDQPIVYSAAIAFFTIFSLPAILVIVVLIGTLFFDKEQIKEEIVNQIGDNVSADAAQQVSEIIENVMKMPDNFIFVIIAILVIFKSATMIFAILQKALNSIWKVQLKKGVNFWRIAKYRTIPLLFVLGLGFLLLLTLFLDILQNYMLSTTGILPEVVEKVLFFIVKMALNFAVVFIFFTTIHKTLPDAIIKWRDAIAGGIITTILFLIGIQVIDLIISNIEIDDYYAAAGSLVIILLWIFYSSIILFLCGEITKAYAVQRGHEIKPKPIAVRYKVNVEVEEEGKDDEE